MKRGFLFFFLICLVVVCAYLFIIFYDEAEQTAIRQLNDGQRIHAQQASQGIGDFFKTWIGILNSFSKMDGVNRVDDDGKRYMALFYEAHQEQIRAITRVDAGGRILHSVPFSGAEGKDISGQPHMLEILREHKPVVSDVFRTVQGFDAVALHVPVFKGTTFQGTIAIVIDFASLAQRYLEVIKIGKTGYAWVVGRDGTTLYSPVPGFVGKSVFDNCRDYPAIISMAREMLLGHEGSTVYTFDRIGDRKVAPVKKYAVYMPIPIVDSFWSIVVASAEDEVLASLASFRNRLYWVVAMLLAGGVIFALISAKAWLIVAEENNRRRAENELRESEQRFRAIFNAANDAFFIHDLETGAILDVNQKMCAMYGMSREEALRSTVADFSSGIPPFAGEDAAEWLRKAATGTPQIFEWQAKDKDGRLFWVEVNMRRAAIGPVERIIVSVRDIAERKMAEEELARYRENLEEQVVARTSDLEGKQRELEKSREALQYLLEDVNEAKQKLEEKNQELERFNKLFVDRELKMVELKQKIRALQGGQAGSAGHAQESYGS